MVTSVRLGDLDTVRDLLELGLAQVDWRYRGASLLCLSVCRGDGQMVELLTRAGADVNQLYTYQVEWTPLIGPDPSEYYALIGVATPTLLSHKDTAQGTQSLLLWAFVVFLCVFMAYGKVASMHAFCATLYLSLCNSVTRDTQRLR